MSDRQKAGDMLRRQIAELEAILVQAQQDFNAVRGSERVSSWKARTAVLLADQLGREAAQRFADRQPGPSFSQDLLEELGDEVEMYRTHLLQLLATTTAG